MIIPIPVYSDDCHIRIKRDCLELYFSDLVPDDQLVYEFTDEAECCQRVEFEVAAGEVASIRICGSARRPPRTNYSKSSPTSGTRTCSVQY